MIRHTLPGRARLFVSESVSVFEFEFEFVFVFVFVFEREGACSVCGDAKLCPLATALSLRTQRGIQSGGSP
jgi:hypothetical protein